MIAQSGDAHMHTSQRVLDHQRKKGILRVLRRYIHVASIDEKGMLIIKKSDPFVQERRLIIIPNEILPGLITALHIQLGQPTKHQLLKLFSRYFYGINCSTVVNNVVRSCNQCESLKKIPKEVLEQSSTSSPEQLGKLFAADVCHSSSLSKIFCCTRCILKFYHCIIHT